MINDTTIFEDDDGTVPAEAGGDLTLDDLGLSPDLSGLPQRVADLIRRGSGPSSCWEDALEVCGAMFEAGCGLDEVWMVMTSPEYGISEPYFSMEPDAAEEFLKKVVDVALERFFSAKRAG